MIDLLCRDIMLIQGKFLHFYLSVASILINIFIFSLPNCRVENILLLIDCVIYSCKTRDSIVTPLVYLSWILNCHACIFGVMLSFRN